MFETQNLFTIKEALSVLQEPEVMEIRGPRLLELVGKPDFSGLRFFPVYKALCVCYMNGIDVFKTAE